MIIKSIIFQLEWPSFARYTQTWKQFDFFKSARYLILWILLRDGVMNINKDTLVAMKGQLSSFLTS